MKKRWNSKRGKRGGRRSRKGTTLSILLYRTVLEPGRKVERLRCGDNVGGSEVGAGSWECCGRRLSGVVTMVVDEEVGEGSRELSSHE